MTAWYIKMRGPVYVAMFKPPGAVFIVVLGVIFLWDPLYHGSLIGAMMMVGGFYAVMWGNAKEDMTSGPKACEALPKTSQKLRRQSERWVEDRLLEFFSRDEDREDDDSGDGKGRHSGGQQQ
ncbi:hypothetical protein CDL15_Pgr009683 [Punica granatum]|nr:hypothetical protein CDL15_Pgr009683 [Punica granatum]